MISFTAIESARAHRCARAPVQVAPPAGRPRPAHRPHPAGRAAVRLPAGDTHRPPPPASPLRPLRLPRATGAWRAAACALAAAFVLLLCAGSATAQTTGLLVSNTGDPHSGVTPWPSTRGISLTSDNAQAFTTGSYAGGYKLTLVTLLMQLGAGAPPTYTVSIHSDSSNFPGTSLGTLRQEGSVPVTVNPVRFRASGSGIDLDANTRYWVVLDVSTRRATYKVHLAHSDAEDSGTVPGWSIANERRWRAVNAGTWGANTDTTVLALAISGHEKDTTKPTLAWHKAEVNGTTVTLYFDERLKHSATPGVSDFWFQMGGTNKRPTAASTVHSNSVTIQVPKATHGQTVRFAYTPPSSTANRLQDRAGNFVDAIAQWQDVVNVTPPAVSSAAVNGATLVLTFDGDLWERSVPKASAFTVSRTRSGTTTTVRLAEPNPVAVRGRTVTLALAEAVVRADTVTVAYTAPAGAGMGPKLRDADNDRLPVPGFSAQSVTNNSPNSSTSPLFLKAAVNGNTLTVDLGHLLQTVSSQRPLGTAFAVSATPPGGTARTISGSGGRVAISGNRVTVNLADAVDRSERVTVSYTRPSTHGLRSNVGGKSLVNSFRNQPVTNNTPGTAAPAFESASYARSVITVNFDGPFTGCADRIAWSFKVDGGTQRFPLAVRCKGRSVELSLDFLSQVPRIEAARRLTVSYHKVLHPT